MDGPPPRPWLPVSIDGVQLLSKSCFGDTEYHILLTDMQCVWEERMASADIETRAQELNRRLRAPVKAFFSHLSEVVRPALTGSGGGTNISVTQQDGNIDMKLKSELAGLPFHWEFHCTPAPVTVVCSQLVRPLLAMSFLLQRQVEQLGGLLGRKDAEIQDYRENGATLSRERLQTEVFEERTYRENFMSKLPVRVPARTSGVRQPTSRDEAKKGLAASIEGKGLYAGIRAGSDQLKSASQIRSCKALPLLASDQSDSLQFDAGLQQLYAAVLSHGSSRKRKLSEDPSVEETPVDEADTTCSLGASKADSGAAEEVQLEAAGAKMADRAAERKSLPSAPAARPPAKPKKKKVGLFR